MGLDDQGCENLSVSGGSLSIRLVRLKIGSRAGVVRCLIVVLGSRTGPGCRGGATCCAKNNIDPRSIIRSFACPLHVWMLGVQDASVLSKNRWLL